MRSPTEENSVFASYLISQKKYCVINYFRYEALAMVNATETYIMASVISIVIRVNWPNAVSLANELWWCDTYDMVMRFGDDKIRRTIRGSCNSENTSVVKL